MAVTCAVMLGFALDALLGDPKWFPHPVCAVGKLISCMEKLLRRLFPPRKGAMIFAGVVLWIVVCGVSFAVPFLVLRFLARINFWLGFAANSILCWLIFARKSLSEAGQHVYRAVKESVEEGRKAVAWYVGRDTAALSEEGVIKAAVETIAENLTDGVVSPLIYMLIGGAPLALTYKAINTMDSMLGYKNEKYLYFGRAAAKLDDVANYIPSRLAALLWIMAAAFTRNDAKGAWRIWRRDRRRHASPNSAQTESACAGALGVQLAGPAYYFGEYYAKPTIGDPLRPIEPEDILRADRMMYVASGFALAFGCAIRGFLG